MDPFEYAVLRVVPRVERGESINAGVLVYCRARDYLAGRVGLDPARVRTLDPTADVSAIDAALQGFVESGPGRGADDGIGPRFRWLTAPRSTVVQPGPVHTGLTDDPGAELERLFALLVRPVE